MYTQSRWIGCGLLLALISCGSENSGPTGTNMMPTAPSSTAAPAPAPSRASPAAATWISEDVRLDNKMTGFPGRVADTSTIQLKDGRWRMYVFTGGQYRSAISPDGLSFKMEAGTRLPEGLGQIRVLRLSDGRLRAYSTESDGIVSSVSSDEGLTFTRESGNRMTTETAGLTPSGPSIVRMKEDEWRMYFSDLPVSRESDRPHKVVSAVSSDLLNWKLDDGVRVGAGATLSGSAERPAALANADGSVTLFYVRNDTGKMMTATSADGLAFATERDTGILKANDPDVIRHPDVKVVRMYYNRGDDSSGAVFSSRLEGAR